MIMSHVDDIIEENSQEILEALGLQADRNGDVYCSCPVHGGDNRNGFSYKASIGRWSCWTHHCEKEFGSNLMGLIRGVHDFSYPQACNWLKENFKSSIVDDSIRLSKENKKFIGEVSRNVEHTSEKIYPPEILSRMNHHVEYFLSRGLEPKTLAFFKCFNGLKGNFNNRSCFTIFNLDGDIVGFGGRKNDEAEQCSKWYYNCPLSKHLLNSNHNKGSKSIVLTEGFIDTAKIWQSGFTNVCSTFSNKISQDQIKILLKLGAKNIYLAYDNDEAGDYARQQIKEKCELYFNIHDLYFDAHDPGDMSKEDITEMLKNVR